MNNSNLHPDTRLRREAPAPVRILCVDDEGLLREFLSMLLTRAGFECHCVGDGQEAFERIAAAPDAFDVLVTDLCMPGLDGMTLIKQARKHGFQGRVVIFSGSVNIVDAERLASVQPDAILHKPAHSAEILGAVAYVLSLDANGDVEAA